MNILICRSNLHTNETSAKHGEHMRKTDLRNIVPFGRTSLSFCMILHETNFGDSTSSRSTPSWAYTHAKVGLKLLGVILRKGIQIDADCKNSTETKWTAKASKAQSKSPRWLQTHAPADACVKCKRLEMPAVKFGRKGLTGLFLGMLSRKSPANPLRSTWDYKLNGKQWGWTVCLGRARSEGQNTKWNIKLKSNTHQIKWWDMGKPMTNPWFFQIYLILNRPLKMARSCHFHPGQKSSQGCETQEDPLPIAISSGISIKSLQIVVRHRGVSDPKFAAWHMACM